MKWYVLFDDFEIGQAEDHEFRYQPYGTTYNVAFDSFREAKAALVDYHRQQLQKARDNFKKAKGIKKDKK